MDGVNIKPIQFNQSIDLETEIDFSGALGELDIDLADVLSWTAKTAGTAATGALVGSFIPGIGTLIGAGVGAFVGGIAHACSGDGGKADARKAYLMLSVRQLSELRTMSNQCWHLLLEIWIFKSAN